MRIGFDGGILTRRLTGVGIYTVRLIESLAELDSGNEIIVFANQDLKRLNLPVEVVVSRMVNPTLFTQLKLPRLIEDRHIDILHGPNFYLPLRKNILSVLTVHDLSAQLFPNQHSFKHRISQRLFNPSLRRADRIIAVSAATARDIEEYYSSVSERVRVVHNGIDNSIRPVSDKEKARVRKHYDLPERFILFIGTIEPRKNIENLIRGYSRIHLRESVRLVISGGKGWKYDEIFELVRELRLEDSVIFTGYIDTKDLPALYSSAEVFCYPSFYEGFGLPVLESMACGTPVISSNVSSLPEVAGDAALLVNPNEPGQICDGINRVLEDEGFRRKLIDSGQKRAECFSWRKTALKTLAIYEELM